MSIISVLISCSEASFYQPNNQIFYVETVDNSISGSKYLVYEGYFSDNVSWFDDKSPIASNTSLTLLGLDSFTPLTAQPTPNQLIANATLIGNEFSCQFLGYFAPLVTKEYIFGLPSVNASYFWIGEKALSGYSVINADIKNAGLHLDSFQKISRPISLTAGRYYPFRIQAGGLNSDLFSIRLNVNYFSPSPNQVANTVVLNSVTTTGFNP